MKNYAEQTNYPQLFKRTYWGAFNSYNSPEVMPTFYKDKKTTPELLRELTKLLCFNLSTPITPRKCYQTFTIYNAAKWLFTPLTPLTPMYISHSIYLYYIFIYRGRNVYNLENPGVLGSGGVTCFAGGVL